jgi:AMP-polyphosphate phosphotransferase
MMEETATKQSPWHLIPANNKPYGRIVAFCILADRLGKDVSLDPRPIDPDLLKEAKRVLNLSARLPPSQAKGQIEAEPPRRFNR